MWVIDCAPPQAYNISVIIVPCENGEWAWEGSPMVKVSVMLKRKPGMSTVEFHRYWKDVHGPLVLGVSEFMRHFRQYVQCHAIAEAFVDTPGVASQYDGIAEVWADSLDEVKRALAEPRYLEIIR